MTKHPLTADASRLFLIGYRGSGKSTVGRLLAAQLGWDSVDSDDLVEDRAGKSIAQIFADEGEAAFRDLEEQVVGELADRDKTVISLGGGAVLREATRQQLANAGPVVWLRATPPTLAERLARDVSTNERRPSLTGGSVIEEIATVLAARQPIYAECATLTIDADALQPEAIAQQLAAWLRGGK